MCQEPRRISPPSQIAFEARAPARAGFTRIADRPVLGGAQLGRSDAACLMVGPRLEQFRRAQQAADMVGAERRVCHCRSLPVLSGGNLLFSSCYRGG